MYNSDCIGNCLLIRKVNFILTKIKNRLLAYLQIILFGSFSDKTKRWIYSFRSWAIL